MTTVNTSPQPIDIDLSKTAVLVIDMQNDFGSKGGMFDRAGMDIEPIRKVVPAISRALAAARAARIPVVYIAMGHNRDLSDAGPVDAPHQIKHAPHRLGETIKAPDGSEGRILTKDTWNTRIVEELAPMPGDFVVSKHRYSGFYDTKLDETLKSVGAKYLIVTGCTTSVCVESTIRDAMYRDYSCILLKDCTAEPNFDSQTSIKIIEMLFGWTATSQDFIAALRSHENMNTASNKTSSA
jgi:ureidoacrylate peracid hydrolase